MTGIQTKDGGYLNKMVVMGAGRESRLRIDFEKAADSDLLMDKMRWGKEQTRMNTMLLA